MKAIIFLAVSAFLFFTLIVAGLMMSAGQAQMMEKYIRDQDSKPIEIEKLETFKHL